MENALGRPTVREKLLGPVVLAGLWLLMIVIVRPVGDFPLQDDWSYAQTVRSLVEKGRLEFTGWMSVTLVAQVLWGALFCLPFGFSFTALRVSTLTLGLAGVLATHAALTESKTGRTLAFLGAATIAVNPFEGYLLHSTTPKGLWFGQRSERHRLHLERLLHQSVEQLAA